ncbi:hypothetical protein [Kineococcus sp. NPDC059986]|uniref:hypothetical protein n=1 Tax=Kineococcus sp. NPDC059986 TaxID=3155538 RepID=UPI00344BB13F
MSFDGSALPVSAPLPWQSTSCAGTVCQDQVIDDHESTWLGVENDQLGAGPVTARLKVVAADGTVLVDSATKVTPRNASTSTATVADPSSGPHGSPSGSTALSPLPRSARGPDSTAR